MMHLPRAVLRAELLDLGATVISLVPPDRMSVPTCTALPPPRRTCTSPRVGC